MVQEPSLPVSWLWQVSEGSVASGAILIHMLNDKTNTRIATKRTTVNAAVIGGIVYLAQRIFGVEIDPTDPLILLGVPVVVGIGYRASRWLTARFPALAVILFGDSATPDYQA